MVRNARRRADSIYEEEVKAGLVYLLTDLGQAMGRHVPVAIYTEPVLAIHHTGTDPKEWHHLFEHYWDNTGRWELTPFVLNEPKQWAQKEFESVARERRAEGTEINKLLPKYAPKRRPQLTMWEEMADHLGLDRDTGEKTGRTRDDGR